MATIDTARVPLHVSLIMDGNGRWAVQRGLPRLSGHQKGAETLQEIVKAVGELGIKYLTVYAFSTENWQRDTAEVDGLMNMLRQYLKTEFSEIKKLYKIFGVFSRKLNKLKLTLSGRGKH